MNYLEIQTSILLLVVAVLVIVGCLTQDQAWWVKYYKEDRDRAEKIISQIMQKVNN